jgi:hypothetical protein
MFETTNCSNFEIAKIRKLFKLEKSSYFRIFQILKLFKLEKNSDLKLFKSKICSNLKKVQIPNPKIVQT